MQSLFNPARWYWIAADGRVFSGPEQAIVTKADGGYAGWIAAGNVATTWPSDETGAQTSVALYEVLAPYGLGAALAPPPTPTQLAAYASQKQASLRDGGIDVNVGSSSTPVTVNVASDATGRGLVTGCVQMIDVASQAGQPAPTFVWINNSGAQTTLTASQMMTIATTLGNYVQATYVTLGAILAAITNGTIDSTAQIDTPAASIATWPKTSY